MARAVVICQVQGGLAASEVSGLPSQIRRVLSRPQDRIRLPSGLKCIFQIQLL